MSYSGVNVLQSSKMGTCLLQTKFDQCTRNVHCQLKYNIWTSTELFPIGFWVTSNDKGNSIFLPLYYTSHLLEQTPRTSNCS